MNDLENDFKRQKLINFIQNGNTNWDDISIESLKISGFVKFIPTSKFENLDPNKKIYDYDELKLKSEYID